MFRRYSESRKCLITCIIISLASHFMIFDLRQNIQYICTYPNDGKIT